MNLRIRSSLLALVGLLGFLVLAGAAERAFRPAVPARSPDCSSCLPGALPPAAPGELAPPIVALRVLVPAASGAHEELEYRILAENRSRAAAHHVVIHAELPANARYVRADPEPNTAAPNLQWRLGTLDAGAQREIRLVLAPAGPGNLRVCVRVTFEHGVCVTTQVAPPMLPALSVRKRGPTAAQRGQPLTFLVTVVNTGQAPAHNVTLVDTLPEGLEHASGQKQLTFALGTLAPGQARQVTYQVVARADGRWCNRAVVTADGGLRDEAEVCIVVTEAKLALTKTGPKQQYLSTPITYRLTVTNPGTGPATNLVLVDRVPAGAVFVSASNGGRLVGDRVQWTLGPLAPGASRTVEVKFRAAAAGVLVNQAEASADRGLRASAEARTEVLGAPGLLLEAVDRDDPIEVGADTAYEIIVRNQGTLPVTNIRLTATVPAELAIVRVQGPVDHKKDEQKIIFEPLKLPANTETIFRIFVRAVKPGDVRFRVEMTADQLPAGAVREEESTNIVPPSNGGP
jgi:uncharacterized repeat protein (TIGR01451 family)